MEKNWTLVTTVRFSRVVFGAFLEKFASLYLEPHLINTLQEFSSSVEIIFLLLALALADR